MFREGNKRNQSKLNGTGAKRKQGRSSIGSASVYHQRRLASSIYSVVALNFSLWTGLSPITVQNSVKMGLLRSTSETKVRQHVFCGIASMCLPAWPATSTEDFGFGKSSIYFFN